MAAPTVRSTAQTLYTSTAATTLTVSKPTGLANGDRLVIRIGLQYGSGVTTAPTVSTPSGLTKTVDPSATNGWDYSAGAPAGVGIVEFQRVCDGTEPSSWTFTLGASGRGAVFAYALQGADSSLASNVYGQTIRVGSTGTTTTLPNITTAVADCFLIESEVAYDAVGTGAISGTNPTFAVRFNNPGSPADGTLYIADGVQTSAGATGARTRNPNGNSGSVGFPWNCVLTAIAPASGGGPVNTPLTVNITATTTFSARKSVGKILAIAATTTQSLRKQISKALAITATSTFSLRKQISKTLPIVATTTFLARKGLAKLLQITATTTFNLNAIRVFLLTLQITATTSFSMVRSIGKRVSITATTTQSLVKSIGKRVLITATTTFSALKGIAKTILINAATTLGVTPAFLPAGGGMTNPKTVAIPATTTFSVARFVMRAVVTDPNDDAGPGTYPDFTESRDRYRREKRKARQAFERIFHRVMEEQPELAREIVQAPTQELALERVDRLAQIILEALPAAMPTQLLHPIVADMRAELINDQMQRIYVEQARLERLRRDEEILTLLMMAL